MFVTTSTWLLACSGEVGTRSNPSATRADKRCDAIFQFWFLLVFLLVIQGGRRAIKNCPSWTVIGLSQFLYLLTTPCPTTFSCFFLALWLRYDGQSETLDLIVSSPWLGDWCQLMVGIECILCFYFFLWDIRTLIWGCCSQAQWIHGRIDKAALRSWVPTSETLPGGVPCKGVGPWSGGWLGLPGLPDYKALIWI